MEITYTKQGDYLLPDLKLKEKKNVKLGRYAKLRLCKSQYKIDKKIQS